MATIAEESNVYLFTEFLSVEASARSMRLVSHGPLMAGTGPQSAPLQIALFGLCFAYCRATTLAPVNAVSPRTLMK